MVATKCITHTKEILIRVITDLKNNNMCKIEIMMIIKLNYKKINIEVLIDQIEIMYFIIFQKKNYSR